MPYIYTKVEDLEGTELVGTRQCVALVQYYAKVPVSSVWREGAHVRDHGNHAAFFLRYGPNGIWIMDQWKHEKKTAASSRFVSRRGKTKSGAYIRPSDNADAFFVIE